MTAENDRGEVGLACSLIRRGDGTVTLILDDTDASSATFPQVWKTRRHFTRKDYDERSFFETDLSDEQLADIGLNVVARLAALASQQQQKRGEPKSGEST